MMVERDTSADPLRIVVGIATSGRREVLAQTIEILGLQTCQPESLVICPIAIEDVDSESLKRFPVPTKIVSGAVGLPAQRNLILSASADADVVVFFDDDFFADSNYLANVGSIFLTYPNVAALTGDLWEDGALGPGLSVKQGLEILKSRADSDDKTGEPFDCYGTYGCNMAFRLNAVRTNSIVFDENLPLYGWQEDIDFSLRLLPYGRVVRSRKLRGVHLGIKSGRTSGVRLGYSQIANPIYLIRKGSVSCHHARSLIWRNFFSNLLRTFHPEPWIDRKGRLKGNFIALIDLVTGRLSPRRILQLD
jgi:GT2 family glycosyltransferase